MQIMENLNTRLKIATRNTLKSLVMIIPMILAESAGMDALQTLMDLRRLHAEGKVMAGVDVLNSKIEEDMIKINVIEPILVKEQVLKSATEAATTILKIDDVIAAAPKTEEKKKGKKSEEE